MENIKNGQDMVDALNGKNIAVIIAHPDDETLWCGGIMLMYPDNNWFIACLCRGSDPDRAPKFEKVLSVYGAKGKMGDLEDGPEQLPLDREVVKEAILELLPTSDLDLVITHNPFGEYTRHLRHEEIGGAVIELWAEQNIRVDRLWAFAYGDGNKKYYPRAIINADLLQVLPMGIWKGKYRIITEIYGFGKTGFEARTTPRKEAFWKFGAPMEATAWLKQGGIPNGNI
ncbi:MAG TPA: PIG-L family deacetylase [Arenibacter sp.]|nr:PIG-L family deacetylase [Arenibacter sp.]